MKKFTFIISIIALSLTSSAQTKDSSSFIDDLENELKDSVKAPKKWSKGGIAQLNFTQARFVNWSQGGENALSGSAWINAFTNYFTRKTTWENSMNLAYGIVQNSRKRVSKSEDKIDLTSKFGRRFYTRYWYFSISFNFRSQFSNGYNEKDDTIIVSHFLAPAYITVPLGIDFRTADNSLSLQISPLTYNLIIVNDQKLANKGSYGVTPAVYGEVNGAFGIIEYGKKFENQLGASFRMFYQKEIYKNIKVVTKLDLFSNYLKTPQNIRVNWELLFDLKVTKFLSANVSTNMIYDHYSPIELENGERGPRLQFKEIMAIGVLFHF